MNPIRKLHIGSFEAKNRGQHTGNSDMDPLALFRRIRNRSKGKAGKGSLKSLVEERHR